MTFLLLCLCFLAIGYISGKRLKISKKVSSQISWGLLMFMLLSLGYGVGANREILKTLNSLGIQAIIICLATIIGSIFIVWLYLVWRSSREH